MKSGNNIIIGQKEKITYCLIAIVIVFSSWTIYYKIPAIWLFYILLILWVFAHNSAGPQKWKLFLTFLFLSLWFYRPMEFSLSFGGIIKSILISSLFLLEKDVLKNIICSIKNILFVLVGIGVVLHVIGIFAGLSLPEITTVFTDDRYYHVYPFIVYQHGLESIRFASIFDEPGYMGSIIVLLLILDGFDLTKIKNLVLFIGGIFTLSLAYYVLAAVGLTSYLIRRKSMKPLLYISIMAVVTIVVCINLFPDLIDIFLSRPEITSIGSGEIESSRGGLISGYNTAMTIITNRPLFNVLFGNGFDSPFILFGGNDGHIIATSSIFRLVFQIGFVGVMYLVVFILHNVERNYISRVFACSFILSLLQRPQVFEPMFIIMLASVVDAGISKRDSHCQ